MPRIWLSELSNHLLFAIKPSAADPARGLLYHPQKSPAHAAPVSAFEDSRFYWRNAYEVSSREEPCLVSSALSFWLSPWWGARGLRPGLCADNAGKMRYVAAYLLAVLGGNESPSSKDLKKILDSVGIETDDERVTKVIGELNGKNIEDVIAQGNSKLASMPAGGAVAVSSGGPAAPAGGPAPAAAEEKKEEKKEESEESDDDMGFGLFD
ncbi:60S acidic ribosomal protein P2-like [Crotalus adamanteus]|uniref:Large ribosomal subunit protein P2 n=3 Tax=Crotalus TaxID=8728 RepID=A0AAW1C8X0_CROAD